MEWRVDSKSLAITWNPGEHFNINQCLGGPKVFSVMGPNLYRGGPGSNGGRAESSVSVK